MLLIFPRLDPERSVLLLDASMVLISEQIMLRILRKIVAGEGDQLGDLSTLAEPAVVDIIKKKVAEQI